MRLYKFILPFLFLIIFITSSSAQVVTPATPIIKDEEVFSKVDEEATFPGGYAAWRKYLFKNLNFGTPADNKAPLGLFIATVEFIVNTDGSISDIKPLTNTGYGTEEEVIRVVKKSGFWKPAMINGEAVSSFKKQPVSFLNTEDGFDLKTTVSPYTLFTETDNEINITVRKVQLKDLNATISEGTITALGNGKFIARVSKAGAATIEVFDKTTKVGAARFEVKAVEEILKK